MRRTKLLEDYYERQKAKKTEFKVNHIEAVVQQRLEANPAWGFKSVAAIERAIGLPRLANCPLVRWTNRLPHGPGNSFWAFPALFPALPTHVQTSLEQEPILFNDWARQVGTIASVEVRFRKAVFNWSHTRRQSLTWIHEAVSMEFCETLWVNIDPKKPYATTEEFNSCL